MSRARRYRIVSIALASLLGAFVALTACSNYDEGDRCETLNGNDDCASPLQCVPKAQINQPFNNSDRCCPVDRSTATHPACTLLQSPVGGDAAPPGDTGPTPDAKADSPAEAAIPEAGSDADANDDGG